MNTEIFPIKTKLACMKPHFLSSNWDFWGFMASMLCAIHCTALPLILTVSSLGVLSFLDNIWVEIIMISIALVVATTSLLNGFRRHHHRNRAMMLAFLGFVLMGLGMAWEGIWWEAALSGLGGVLVAISHFVNWRLIHTVPKQ